LNNYGKIAKEVTKRLKNKENIDIYKTWEEVAKEYFNSESLIKKGCPKNSYIGLCEEGIIKGVKKGKYRKTKNSKNKDYALKAIKILKNNSLLENISPLELWKKVTIDKDKKISHNQQMNVVLELWHCDFINKSQG